MTTPPQTQYVYVAPKQGQSQVQTKTQTQTQTRTTTGGTTATVRTMPGLPRFLGSRMIIFGTWAVSMALVSWDEWSNNGILPRPARLWDTTWLYAGLALVSTVDAIVPIANILAIGYMITLMYQAFQGTGQFTAPILGKAILGGATA